MSIYLAGPMTGYAEYNVPAFLSMAGRLRERGLSVVVPCEEKATAEEQAALSWAEWMAIDLRLVLDCTCGVAVLLGWEGSRGACLEVTVAHALGRPIYCAHALAEGGSLSEARISLPKALMRAAP
jgi:nucleoside 2-deoxyribosyltransferase